MEKSKTQTHIIHTNIKFKTSTNICLLEINTSVKHTHTHVNTETNLTNQKIENRFDSELHTSNLGNNFYTM